MLDFTEEQYTQALRVTPAKVQEVLYAESTSTFIKLLVGRHGVEDKAFTISAIIGYVFVGLIPTKEEFIDALQEEAQLDEDTAQKIAYEIRDKIFAPVAQELAAMQPEPKNKTPKMANRHQATIPHQGIEGHATKGASHARAMPKENIVDLSEKLR